MLRELQPNLKAFSLRCHDNLSRSLHGAANPGTSCIGCLRDPYPTRRLREDTESGKTGRGRNGTPGSPAERQTDRQTDTDDRQGRGELGEHAEEKTRNKATREEAVERPLSSFDAASKHCRRAERKRRVTTPRSHSSISH